MFLKKTTCIWTYRCEQMYRKKLGEGSGIRKETSMFFSVCSIISNENVSVLHRKMKGRMYVKDEQQIKMDRQEI